MRDDAFSQASSRDKAVAKLLDETILMPLRHALGERVTLREHNTQQNEAVILHDVPPMRML